MKIANTTVEKQLSIFKKFSKGDDLTDKGRDLKVERKNKDIVYFRVKYPPIKQRGQITIFNINDKDYLINKNKVWKTYIRWESGMEMNYVVVLDPREFDSKRQKSWDKETIEAFRAYSLINKEEVEEIPFDKELLIVKWFNEDKQKEIKDKKKN